MKIGVLFGQASGQGKASLAVPLVAQAVRGRESAVCAGLFGPGSRGPWVELEPASVSGSEYLERLRASVLALADWGADTFMCLGGDGLAAYVADSLIVRGMSPKILGVALGTANVGPLMGASLGDLESLDLDEIAWEGADALEALEDGRHIAFGFNDVVIGDSFLGSVGDRVASFSAEALVLSGKKLEVEPGRRVAGTDFEVRKNGRILESKGFWASGREGCRGIAQIVASPLRRGEFLGRAVAGALCEAPYVEGATALCIFDFIVVAAGTPEKGFGEFASCSQLIFSAGDIMELSGLGPDAHIIVDGNPYLRRGERLGLLPWKDAAFAARIPGKRVEVLHG